MSHKQKNNASSVVPPPLLSEKEKLKFSFQYYDGKKYCLSAWGENIQQALMRLKEICCMSFNEMVQKRNVLHFHEVDWKTTTEKNGFSDLRLKDMSPFQFALLGINNQKARVFGAYYSGIFYIVWFDLDHQVDPSPLKNT